MSSPKGKAFANQGKVGSMGNKVTIPNSAIADIMSDIYNQSTYQPLINTNPYSTPPYPVGYPEKIPPTVSESVENHLDKILSPGVTQFDVVTILEHIALMKDAIKIRQGKLDNDSTQLQILTLMCTSKIKPVDGDDE